MDGVPAKYKGRMVSKENFRVFIYASCGAQKLVKSWAEYEGHMELGTWFAARKDATPLGGVKEDKKKNSKKTKEDDFLSNARV